MSTNASISSKEFTRLYNALYPTFLSRLGGEYPAMTMGQIQDLYQETMIDVDANIRAGKVSADTNWKGYVYTIGHRKASALVKSFNYRNFESYDVMVTESTLDGSYLSLDRMITEQNEEQKPFYMDEETQEVFEGVLQEMTEANRELIDCFYIKKMKMNEIASRLGYSNANTAKARKNQVMKQLNHRLAAALEELGYDLAEVNYQVRG